MKLENSAFKHFHLLGLLTIFIILLSKNISTESQSTNDQYHPISLINMQNVPVTVNFEGGIPSIFFEATFFALKNLPSFINFFRHAFLIAKKTAPFIIYLSHNPEIISYLATDIKKAFDNLINIITDKIYEQQTYNFLQNMTNHSTLS